MIYLDNAATTGQKPVSVINSVRNALINFNANPGRSGHELSIRVSEEIYKCRKKLKLFFNASNETSVCFTSSCTHAINSVIYGVLKSGDHVIFSSLEHNAVYRTVSNLSKQIRFDFDIATVDLVSDEKTVENFSKLIRNNTKLIIITAASNVLGRKLPLKRIGELCKIHNVLFCVDAAQLAGKSDINIKNCNIDYLCIAPHKSFYAPAGVGVLIAEKNIDNVLIYGGTGVNSLETRQPLELPERIESGTLNIPGIVGLSSGIDFVKSKGINRIELYENKLIKELYTKLKTAGAELYTVFPDSRLFAPVLSFNIRGYSSEKIGEYLNQNNIAVRSGLHCAPLAHKQLDTINRGTVRVSPSIFNNSDDIEKLIFYLKKVI